MFFSMPMSNNEIEKIQLVVSLLVIYKAYKVIFCRIIAVN
jgi:hypothetical protein